MIDWLAAPGILALLLVLANLRWVTRLRPGGSMHLPRISALVPARDEESSIGACVRALLATGVAEVLVYDDQSCDGTAAEVLAIKDPRVRLLRGTALPAGWAGKPHACARLAEAASGELLWFVDADVRVEPGAAAALVEALGQGPRRRAADMVTAVPRQLALSWGELAIVPLLQVVYYALAPLFLIDRTRDPRIVAANGQLLFVRAAAYRALGGHARVRGAVVEDQALCRAAKEAGLVVRFADASLVACCRMYRGFGEAFRGFTRNLYLGLGATPARLVLALAVVAVVLLLPLASPWGAAALFAARLSLAVRVRQRPAAVLLHPVSVLVLFAIGVRSLVLAHSGRIEWRRRLYGLPGGST